MRTDSIGLQRDYLVGSWTRDGWLWIAQQVKTFDEHDPGNSVKAFPSDKAYLEAAFRIWQRYAFLIEEKSRQMMETWRVVASHAHLAQFFPFSRVLYSSKDEDDAYKLLERHFFIWENQSPWVKERFPAKMLGNQIQYYHRVGGKLRKTSVVEALSQGVDETRSMVGSAVVLDEAAFCNHFAGFIQAAIPMTVTGKLSDDPSKPKGGRMTILSSANPGPFELAIDETKKRSIRREQLMPGLEVWHPDNASDFAAIRLHHSADPSPEIVAKVEEAKRKYISIGALPSFQKEYEIEYDALSGERVWPHLSKDLHGLDPSFQIPDDWVRFRVIDPGFRNPCAINWFAMSPAGWRGCKDVEGRDLSVMICYRERHLVGYTIDQIYLELVSASQGEEYSVTLIDPSSDIHRGNEKAGMSTFEQLIALGVRGLIKANNVVDAGIGEVRRRLAVHGSSPGLLFFTNLDHTWQESTHYRYRNQTAAMALNHNADESPVKKNDHHPDNIRYACQFRQLPKVEPKAAAPMRSFGWHLGQHLKKRQMSSLLGNAAFAGRIIP
jgi:hypothetical protein